MKIGFSLGKCVRDIVEGKVDIDDVVVVLTRTSFKSSDLFQEGLYEYSIRADYWKGLDYQKCIDVCVALWEAGKLHQPRTYGQFYASPVRQDFVWMDLAPTSSDAMENEMVKKAWAQYQMVLKLATERKKFSEEDIKNAISF